MPYGFIGGNHITQNLIIIKMGGSSVGVYSDVTIKEIIIRSSDDSGEGENIIIKYLNDKY